MQPTVIDKAYRFVPPHKGSFWPRLARLWLKPFLRRAYGIEAVELRGVERLRASLAAGHGVALTPNHCRPCDAMVMGLLGQEVGRPFFYMASWRLFMQGRLRAWWLNRLGCFSVYREGADREALRALAMAAKAHV
ncbi:MAG TPA: hypothetical protein VNL14_17060 [Candidatus Acidoferrales bacterium]|nr:hypothetical protein [Candidatus Acidoferrales bacterium]